MSDEWICSDRDSLCAGNDINRCATESTTNIIQIEHAYEQYNQTIECDDTNGKNCEIICKGDHSCSDASVYCPVNYDCKIHCIGDDSCERTMINAVYCSSLWIKSIGASALFGAIVYAPIDNNTLIMDCSGGSSCRASTLHASYSTIRSLRCSGSDSCEQMQINADYSSYIDWKCLASESCNAAKLFQHDLTSMYFSLDCAYSRSCLGIEVMTAAQTATLNCASATSACGNGKIYCTSPTQTCNITCNSY
eukprot:372837_1